MGWLRLPTVFSRRRALFAPQRVCCGGTADAATCHVPHCVVLQVLCARADVARWAGARLGTLARPGGAGCGRQPDNAGRRRSACTWRLLRASACAPCAATDKLVPDRSPAPPPCAAEVFALDSAHRVDGKAACLRVRTCVVQARTQGRAGQGRACCWLPAPACRRLCTDARVCVLSRHACRVYARAPPTDPVPRGQLWPTGSVGAGHRVSRPRGTGSVGDSVGEGRRLREMLLLRPCGDAAAGIRWSRCCQDRGNA